MSDDTVFRSDMTVMRDDASDTGTSLSDSSWRSGVAVEGSESGAEAPKVLKQRFVLEQLIGTGGMGSVFRAKDLRKVEARGTQPFVAVKVLNNDFRHHPEAFIALEREATKSQGLRHPNIVSIYDFDKDGDVPFITMELLEGDELADLLKSYPSGLPDELAWQVIEGMVSGLRHAHDELVVHADFKPGNIYVTQRKATKIFDFGIARAMRLNEGGEDTDFDPARLAALTPAYASREMLNGDNPEPRDDLYSLGVVTYMVLTGHHPYGRLPASDAAREGLKPERIKRLSRRRWQILEHCLRFNRQDRPASADEVYEGLFGKSPWRSWSVAATAALVAMSLLLITVQDDVEIREVKAEVRQETLVDAQIARVAALLVAPEFNPDWEELLFTEVQTLQGLAGAESASAMVTARVEEIYSQHIAGASDLGDAFEALRAGVRFGPADAAKQSLHGRLLAEFARLAATPVDAAWLIDAEEATRFAQAHYAASTALASARADFAAHVSLAIPQLLAAGQLQVAQGAWNTFSPVVFSEERWRSAQLDMQTALAEQAQSRAAAVSQSSLREEQSEMGELLSGSCLRLDIEAVGARIERVAAAHPSHLTPLRAQVTERVSQCVQRLSAIDPERALAFKTRALRELEAFAEVDDLSVDPCSMQYLVGNGKQTGKGGFCADQIAPDARGPRLVVVPGDASLPNFAISKYEITWGEFARFCHASDRCAVVDTETLPVTGVSIAVIEAYAQWLSEQTGYRYRLPTQQEWRQAAVGVPDPNRNCRIDVGGVSRGDAMLEAQAGAANELGLVHMLGNAQEVVKSELNYVAVGGTFSDPIEMCLAQTERPMDPGGDGQTGFRVVREVS